jgi:hypothetical protein
MMGQERRWKRGLSNFRILRWFRRRTFESLDEHESEKREPLTRDDENQIEYDDDDSDDDEYDDDEMSGYLDVTIEDLSKVRRIGSQLDPITEEDIVVISLPQSPKPFSLHSPHTELKSPSAMRLTRTRLRSPRILDREVALSPKTSKSASTSFSMVKVLKQPPPANKLVRNRTQESFQGSLESMDSLAESYWDPEDDASHMTPVATNLARSSDFFLEHVRFLKVQTQPRQVEVVWSTPPSKI